MDSRFRACGAFERSRALLRVEAQLPVPREAFERKNGDLPVKRADLEGLTRRGDRAALVWPRKPRACAWADASCWASSAACVWAALLRCCNRRASARPSTCAAPALQPSPLFPSVDSRFRGRQPCLGLSGDQRAAGVAAERPRSVAQRATEGTGSEGKLGTAMHCTALRCESRPAVQGGSPCCSRARLCRRGGGRARGRGRGSRALACAAHSARQGAKVCAGVVRWGQAGSVASGQRVSEHAMWLANSSRSTAPTA